MVKLASHLSTPESVLNAPKSVPEYIHEHGEGSNRRERRHFQGKEAAELTKVIHFHPMRPATMTPYVKPAIV